ncbi:Translocation protein TolB [Sandaracinus amylolyticus]|nr:alkaline phosphatase PhoX [Sandaracinus amylolyticus]UJR80147.1 Translocation protein TolB [Sandaracinus amylolyticus]
MSSGRVDWGVTGSGLLVPRRKLLKGGLAGFAAAMMSRTLIGCDDGGPASALDAGGVDANGIDAMMADAGSFEFPHRDIPTPPPVRSRIADIGALGEPDANGVRLAPGFTSRIIGRAGELVAGTTYEWHRFPDGGATYATEDGGWIYASNSEVPLIGGVGAVRFDADGEIVAAHRILDRTSVNCAGGKTPWHTWLSCEETGTGQVHECDPWGEHAAVVRPALGRFKHEAAAIDPVRAHVYLTEDESDGRFYRFVPDRLTSRGHPDLSSGRLEVAVVGGDGRVTWAELPDPRFEGEVPTRMQIAESTAFRGGEGIWYHEGIVYFSTKGDNRVWALDVETNELDVLYDIADYTDPVPLRGVDNLTVSCCGDVLVAEDGGSMQVVAILPDGQLKPLVQVVGHAMSEITGPAFDPSGTRLYFSSQRGVEGGGGVGVTFEITGPFHEPV